MDKIKEVDSEEEQDLEDIPSAIKCFSILEKENLSKITAVKKLSNYLDPSVYRNYKMNYIFSEFEQEIIYNDETECFSTPH